ncbi:MAG: KilA-N domain-containing protein [Prevotellaceae bacterium]|jgi:hypothetical protein|nr:KilA-N domain-containing protein [Prevotellaceae bacterium]
MSKKETITVQGTEITVIQKNKDDYISLTDMAGYKDTLDARIVVSNWMSSRYTLEFLGIWEQVNNPDFNRMEFHTVKNADGRLVLTPKRWVELTNAIGIFSKSGRYGGGIFAHKDIAFEFGTWLSAEFKYYLIKEFQRLKEDEQQRLSLEWNLQRTLSKINYRIHTDAINELICLSNMENINAVLIHEGLPQRDRLIKLNQIAIQQMSVLQEVENRKLLR